MKKIADLATTGYNVTKLNRHLVRVTHPLQYSCLENPVDRGAWQATVLGIAGIRHDLATKPPPPLEGALTSNFPLGAYKVLFL